MFNYKVLKFLSIVSFATSAIFTILLINSGMHGTTASLLGALMAISLELAKVGFFYEAITNKTVNPYIRVALGGIACLLVASSIIASAGYIQNQANHNRNEQITESREYNSMVDARDRQERLLSAKEQEIKDVRSSYNARINELAKLRDEYPRERWSAPDKIREYQNEINQLNNEMTNRINEVNREIAEINNNLNAGIDTSTINLNETSGYGAFFSLMAEKSKTDRTPQELELYFFILLSVIFECVAVLTAYLYKIKSEQKKPLKNDSTDNERVLEIKPKETKKDELVASKKIGFQHEGLDSSKINKYKEYMYKTQENGYSKGYSTIAKDLGMKVEDARAIKGHLQQQGIIKTEGNRTRIIKNV